MFYVHESDVPQLSCRSRMLALISIVSGCIWHGTGCTCSTRSRHSWPATPIHLTLCAPSSPFLSCHLPLSVPFWFVIGKGRPLVRPRPMGLILKTYRLSSWLMS
ncbi:unnamed protein product [Periconia digitata]|uniref:Uncharacterized protein n=1 Tax=Periconia digitata TaxID=1303443 RepID=A0A9W4U3S4_9PLEO|nr:unnamed protein product [Periconia digitata]